MLDSRLDVMNRLGRAMADPTRSRILAQLLDGPTFPGDLAEGLGLTKQNVSNHLACLRGCGIVTATPVGRNARYAVADPHISDALTTLMNVVLAVDVDAECTDDNCTVPGCCS